MPKLTNLTVEMSGDSSKLSKAARAGLKSVRRLSSGIADASKKLAGLGTVGVVGAAAGLAALGNAARSNIDRQAKLADNLNVSVGFMQQLELMSKLSGTSVEKMGKALQILTRSIGDAQRGSKPAIRALEEIGLTVDEATALAERGGEELLLGVLGRIGDMDSETRKASVSAVLLGRAWQEIEPFIAGLNDNLNKTFNLFNKNRLFLSEEEADDVERMNDQVEVLGALLTSLRDKVFAPFAPLIEDLVNAAGRWVEKTLELNGGVEGLVALISQGILTVLEELPAKMRPFIAAWDVLTFLVRSFVQGLEFIGTKAGQVGALFGALGRGEFSGAAGLLGDITGDLFDTGLAEVGGEAALRNFDEFLRASVEAQRQAEEQSQLQRDIRDGIKAINDDLRRFG